MLCSADFGCLKKLSTKGYLQNVVSRFVAENLCLLNLFFSWSFALFLNMGVKRVLWNFWWHKVQFLSETNKILSHLRFDARQPLVAVPLELKSLSLLLKTRGIINILPTSFFSVRTVSCGLAFFVRIDGPGAKGKKLGPQLTVQLSNSVSKRYDLADV